MSTAFTAALPLLEKLKTELAKLDTATKEIAKAHDSAKQNQQAAKQAVSAAGQVAATQQELVESLARQHQASLSEQELILRAHAEDLTERTVQQTARQLEGIKKAAESAQELIDNLLETQPPLLAAIGEQHLVGMNKQQEMMQRAAQAWADSLHQQMQTELKLVRQVTETYQKNARQQHDEFSAVANQLQIVTGRVTAFSEVMNAANFTTKLASLDAQQQKVLSGIAAGTQANTAGFNKLDAASQKHKAELDSLLQAFRQQGTEAAKQQQQLLTNSLTKLEEGQRARQAELQGVLQAMTVELQRSHKTQRMMSFIVLGALVVFGAIIVLVR